MALSLLAFLLLSLPFLLLLSILLLRRKPQPNLPSGPRGLPFLGNLHQLSPLLHRDLRRLSKLHGPLLSLRLGRAPAIVVSSASIAREVLGNQDLSFCSRPALAAFRKYSYGFRDVAVSPYADSWRNLRRIFINELLSAKRTRSFACAREDETRNMVRFIATNDAAVDVGDIAAHLSSSVISRVAFGLESGGGVYGGRCRFRRIFAEGNAVTASFFAADHWTGLGWVDAVRGLAGRMERNAAEIDEFYREVIEQHLDVGRRGEGYEEDVVDVLIRLWKDGDSGISLDHIKGALMNIIVAGTETTAATIVWAMTELMRHPTAMKKAQDEVRSLVGNKGKVDEQDIPQMQFLRSVLNETLRLHAPLPLLIMREAIRDCRVGGYDVRAGTRVFVNAWAIGRDENSWEDAEDFVPKRFLGSTIDHKGHDFQFVPFGAGRRICPGMNFGIATAELALANLLYAFNWELPDGVKKEDVDTDEAPGLIVHKKSEFLLVARNNVIASEGPRD